MRKQRFSNVSRGCRDLNGMEWVKNFGRVQSLELIFRKDIVQQLYAACLNFYSITNRIMELKVKRTHNTISHWPLLLFPNFIINVYCFKWFLREAYSERYKTSKMELFAKIIDIRKLLAAFAKIIILRCLTRFWIGLCFYRSSNQ